MLTCYAIMTIGLLLLSPLILFVVRRESSNYLIFSPFLIFCLNEILRVWPAVIYARWESISTDNHAALIVVSSTLTFAVSYLITRDLNRWRVTAHQYVRSPLQEPHEAVHLGAILKFSIVLTALGSYLYQGIPPALRGIYDLMNGGVSSGIAEIVSLRRLELTKGHYFGGAYRGQGVVRFLMRTGWPFLTIIALSLYVRQHRRLWATVSLALLAACFVFIGGDGTRGPLLVAMVAILTARSYLCRLPAKTCLMFAGLFTATLLVLSLGKYLSGALESGTLWSDGLASLAERILVGNAVHTIYAIEFVREGDLPFHWGSIHLADLTASLPFVKTDKTFTYELFLLENPTARVTQTTFANTTYLGVLYAEGGWLACIVTYLGLGVLLARLSEWLFGQTKTATHTGFAGLVGMYLGEINLSGLPHCLVLICVLTMVSKLYGLLLPARWHHQTTQPAGFRSKLPYRVASPSLKL
jgi:hypothetical protein